MAVITHPHQQQVRIASGLDALAGLWLFISAWAIPMEMEMAWSNVIVGIVVVIMASTRAFGAFGSPGLSWANVVLGVWVLISPWVLGAETQPSAWNAVLTGLAIIILGSWSAIATNTERRGPGAPPPPAV